MSTHDASRRSAARSAGPMSVEKMLAWNANGSAFASVDRAIELLKSVDTGHRAKDLQLRHLGIGWRLQQDGRHQRRLRVSAAAKQACPARCRFVKPRRDAYWSREDRSADRPPSRGSSGSPTRRSADPGGQSFDESVDDVLMHEDPLCRHADLARVVVAAFDNRLDHGVQIGAAVHNHRSGATVLQGASGSRGEPAVQMPTHPR